MTVRTLKSGFEINFTMGGKRYIERIPGATNPTRKKQVERMEYSIQDAIRFNDETALERYPESKILKRYFLSDKDVPTVDQYSSTWFKRYQSEWRPATRKSYTKRYLTYIKPLFGSEKLTNIKAGMFQERMNTLELSGKMKNEIRSILYQVCEEAYRDEVIDDNPIRRHKRFKQIQKEPQPFNKVEIQQILGALNAPYKEFYQLAFYTGMRPGELIALRWEDIDHSNQRLYVRRNISVGVEGTPKTSSGFRTIELHPEAQSAIDNIETKTKSGFLFINPITNEGYKSHDLLRKSVWKPALERIGITYRTHYECRHTFASMMLSSGKNPMWVAHQMGHSDWGMIRKVYGRWIP